MIELSKILQEIENAGGRCYYVGGCVRDQYLNIEVYDYDIEVYNITFQLLYDVIKSFGEVIANEKFYTIKLKKNQNYEFTLAREEVCVGTGHRDFKMIAIKDLDYKKACMRRDFTINSIMKEYATGTVIDCYDGLSDLHNKKIKHISPKFREDALRILRAMRFSSKLDFEIDEETLKMCLDMVDDLQYISSQRFSKEFYLMFDGSYVQKGVNYFLYLLKDFFGIKYYDEDIINTLNDVSCSRVRILLFFYAIRNNDLMHIIDKCIVKKSNKDEIMYLLNSDMDFYTVASHFNKDETVLLYKYISNIDIETKYNKYEKLKSKYNAKYFIDLGYSGADISTMIKSKIIDELQ